MDGRYWRVPQRWRHLHRMHNAGVSGQIYAVHGSTAWLSAVVRRRSNLRAGDPRITPVYPGISQQGAELALQEAQFGQTEGCRNHSLMRDKRLALRRLE